MSSVPLVSSFKAELSQRCHSPLGACFCFSEWFFFLTSIPSSFSQLPWPLSIAYLHAKEEGGEAQGSIVICQKFRFRAGREASSHVADQDSTVPCAPRVIVLCVKTVLGPGAVLDGENVIEPGFVQQHRSSVRLQSWKGFRHTSADGEAEARERQGLVQSA